MDGMGDGCWPCLSQRGLRVGWAACDLIGQCRCFSLPRCIGAAAQCARDRNIFLLKPTTISRNKTCRHWVCHHLCQLIPPAMDDLKKQLQGSLSTIHVAVDWTHPQRDFGFHVLVGTGLTWVGGGGWLACGKFSKPLKKKGRGCHVWQSPRGVRANTVLCTVR